MTFDFIEESASTRTEIHACLLFAEECRKWERAGLKLSEVPDDVVVETWRWCVKEAQR